MNEISVANASWKSEFWLPEKANRKFIYLRPWQKESFNQLKDEMFRWVVAPPGSGKTTLMSLLAYNDVVNKDIDKVVIVVPQNSIKRNYSKIRINLNGNEIKLSPIIVEANNVSRLTRFLKSDLSNLKINSRVIVCTHQTMCRIDDELIKGNISVWVDEAHHLSFDSEESNVLGGKIKIAIKNCRSVNIATATPARHDGAKLVCDRAKFAEYTLTIDKHIKMHTKIESMHFNVVKYKQSATECITELYKRSKEPTIIWIPSIRSLPSYGEDCKYKFTSEIAKAISPRHELIDTEYGWTINGLVVVNLVDEMNRKEKLELISSGSIDTIIALEMFKEGDDCPKLSRGIKIGIRSSLVVNNQMNGRLFRHFDGKNKIEVYQVIQEIDAKRSIRDKVGKLISVMVLSIVDIESIIGQPTIIMNKKKFKTGTIWEDYFGDKSVSIRAELIRDILSFGNFNDSKEYIFSWCDSNGIIEDDKFRIVASALSYMASNTKALNKLTKIIDLDLIDQDDLFGWYSKSIDCEYLHKLRVFRDLEEMKKRLIEMARSGEPKPKHNELMYRYLRRFCHEYELGYDKEVHDKLLSLRPD